MQALALVRNAPERDRETEMHIAAASIATRPVVLATHKAPVAARKTHIAPPPTTTSVHILSNDKESLQLDTRDESCQDHRRAGLRLLKGKQHMVGTTSTSNKAAGLGRSRKHFEAIHQTAVSICTEEDEHEVVVVSTTPLTSSIAAVAATVVICSSDEKESSPSHEQSLIITNQEVTAGTTYKQQVTAASGGEPSIASSLDANANTNGLQPIEQFFEVDPSFPVPQERDNHTNMIVAWQNPEAVAVASEEGKSESLMSVPTGDTDAKQQHLSLLEPTYYVGSLPSPHTGSSTRPTTTTSSLLAALSVAFSGATWQLPSTTSSSESTIGGTAPNSSHSLPHHQNPSPFSFDGSIDARANTHHHKSHRPTPLSTKRLPKQITARKSLHSK